MNEVVDIKLGISEKRYGGYKALKTISLILFVVAAAYFGFLLVRTPDALPWGFITVSFLFLLGVSQFGICFSAILRLARAKWARPFYRVGEIMTLAFFPLAVVLFLLLYRFGIQDLLYWVEAPEDLHRSAWLDERFLLLRNAIAQLAFYFIALVYFITGLIPDVKTEMTATGPLLRRRFYRWLLARQQKADVERLKSRVYYYAPVVLISCGIANTFIAWDFGMMLVPHYHSTVYSMYFIMGNMFAGTAMVMLLTALTGRFVDLRAYFGVKQIKSLGIMLTGFALLWLYLFWAQFFVSWFGNLPTEYGVISRSMYGHYAPYFWFMMAFIIGIPIGTLIFAPVKRTVWTMLVLTFVMNAGIWINRYLIVMPALDEHHHAFSSFAELVLTVGMFAGFVYLVLVLIGWVPMVSTWELQDALSEEPAY